jgi:hypothetical protein
LIYQLMKMFEIKSQIFPNRTCSWVYRFSL